MAAMQERAVAVFLPLTADFFQDPGLVLRTLLTAVITHGLWTRLPVRLLLPVAFSPSDAAWHILNPILAKIYKHVLDLTWNHGEYHQWNADFRVLFPWSRGWLLPQESSMVLFHFPESGIMIGCHVFKKYARRRA